VLDIWALSVSCGVHRWSGVRRGVTTCMSVDCDKGDCEDHIHNNVQAASGLTQDSWCLLDSLWGALTSLGVSFDFMHFRSAPLGARCCQTPTREGHALVRIHPEYSYTACRFMGVIWWDKRQVDALLRPSCASKYARLHGLVLHHFSSLHDRGIAIRFATRCTCDTTQTYLSYPSCPGATYPLGPGASSNIDTCPFWWGRAQACSGMFDNLQDMY